MSELIMPQPARFTLNEAGYVVGQSSAAINRAVDRGIIKATLQRRGRHRLRQVGAAELRFLAISGQIEKDLTPAARRKVYDAVRQLPADAHRVDLGVMELKLAEIDRRISERLERLAAIRELVDEPEGGDPVLRGTEIPVHVVAALAVGQTIAEVAADYPSLTPAQIEGAVEYARVYPRTGRPLPTRSLKRMLAGMAASGVWDEGDDGPVTPRPIP